MSKTPFNDGFNSARRDPLDRQETDFDWDSVDEPKDSTDDAMRNASEAIGEILRWTIKVDLDNPRALESIGMRAICAAWVINPNYFNGSSLAEISRQLGCHATRLSPLSAEFSRIFKIRNRGQSHNWRIR